MSPAFIAVGSALAYSASGFLLGALFFLGLWRNARQLVQGASAIATSATMIGRFAGLGALLALASLQGAGPLLEATLGVTLARAFILSCSSGAKS